MLQEVHDFLQRILCFLFSSHISKGDPRFLVRYNFRVCFPEAQGIHPAAHAFSQLVAQQPAQSHKDDNGQHPAQHKAQQHIVLSRDFRAEFDVGLLQPFDQPLIREHRGLVQLLLTDVIGRHKNDLV